MKPNQAWRDITAAAAANRAAIRSSQPVDMQAIVGQATAQVLDTVSTEVLDRIRNEAIDAAAGAGLNAATEMLGSTLDTLRAAATKTLESHLAQAYADAYAKAKAEAAVTVSLDLTKDQCVQHTTTGIVHRNFQHLLRIATSKDGAGWYCHTALVGEAGSGKSYGAEQLANALGIPFELVACHQKMNSADIRGYTIGSDYFASPVYNAYKHGGILCLDEFDRTNTEVTIALNTVLAGSSHQFPNGEKVARHPEFRAVACQNTFGTGANRTYTAATRLDASSTDRFEFLTWNVDEAMELAVAGDNHATRTVQAIRRRAFDLAMDLIISPRRAISTNALMRSGYTLEEALNFAILNRVSDDQRLRLLEGINLNA